MTLPNPPRPRARKELKSSILGLRAGRAGKDGSRAAIAPLPKFGRGTRKKDFIIEIFLKRKKVRKRPDSRNRAKACFSM